MNNSAFNRPSIYDQKPEADVASEYDRPKRQTQADNYEASSEILDYNNEGFDTFAAKYDKKNQAGKSKEQPEYEKYGFEAFLQE